MPRISEMREDGEGKNYFNDRTSCTDALRLCTVLLKGLGIEIIVDRGIGAEVRCTPPESESESQDAEARQGKARQGRAASLSTPMLCAMYYCRCYLVQTLFQSKVMNGES